MSQAGEQEDPSHAQRVKRFALLELFGFFIIFTCMILMRFGI